MDCSLCLEAYNLETRRPKLLPCGHTFCQPCLQGNVRCYIENKVFTHLSDILPDDIYLVRLLEKGAPEKERGKLRLWCNGCEAEAVERCLDNGHKLSSMKTYWHRQALEQLQKIKALLEGLIGGQRGEVPAEEYAVCRGGVDVDLTEGADSWTARVQLGGSGEETSPESSVLRLLLREMDAQNRLRSSSAEVGQNNFLAKITLGADENDEEDLLDGLAALDDEDEEEISHENTSADHLPEVRSTMTVSCYDSSTLQELADAPPDLEGLRLFNVRSAQLLAAHRMPALRRLEAKASRWFEPFLLPPLEHDGGLEHVRLCLHPTTTRSLIFAHQRTLRVVEISTLCSISRRDQSRHVWFEDLDYQRCRQMDNVDSVVEGVRRCRYLPIRPPGTFPRLQRIEFVLYKHGKKYTPPWEWIEKMYPGVLVETSIAGERTIPPW